MLNVHEKKYQKISIFDEKYIFIQKMHCNLLYIKLIALWYLSQKNQNTFSATF